MNLTAELLAPDIAALIKEGAYSEVRSALHGLPPADVADILASLEPADAAIGFRFMPRDAAAEAFAYLAPEVQERLINELGAEGSVRVIEAMSADDRVRLLDELPEAVAERVVASLSPQTRATTQAILGYPPRTVGRLMTPDYLKVKPDWTVAQALDHIRRHGRDAETINVVYVVDDTGKLIDDLRLRQIFLADPGAKIEDLMNRNFVTLRADQPQEEAVQLMARYDRTALPVVDSRGNLIGIVTADDVADVAQQEATEDFQKMGGMEALDVPYSSVGLWQLTVKRGKWLAVLFLGEMLTASAMSHYEDQLNKAIVLTLFLPLIISSGGNSGSQATTLIIRALALGEVKLKDWWWAFRREVTCGLLLGLFLGTIGFIRIITWRFLGWDDGRYTDHYLAVAIAVFVALVGVVLWGSLMGSMLPFLLRRLKLDPATISAPLVATLVDVTGLVIYFTTASIVLRGTLL